MSAVKVLFSRSHMDLQDELQAWLQRSESTIHSISMDSNDHGHCLVLLHEPGGSHRYAGQIFFSPGHASLEDVANRAMTTGRPGGQQLVAVGSNQFGHCLCIIREI
ncbi:MAG TPA: hypothetical protein VD973_11480 [Symbiobacteriaceae bacterium]|jgi:hypothetical protein|nr:hypothetical protein [Symbiobacteriaceae bacterium]